MATIGQQLLQPESGWKRYDDRNENINYVGNWIHENYVSYYKTTASYIKTNGELSFNFTGDKIRIIGQNNSTSNTYCENVKIIIDNVIYILNGKIGSGTQILQFEKQNLKYKEHHIKVINTENKEYDFDAIDIDENGELKPYNPNLYKYLIKQNNNYHTINNNYIDLGKIDNSEELYNVIDEYGYDDLSILTKELNTKMIPTKLENDYYKSFDINLNDIKGNINLIEDDDKKYIEYDCNNYKISDKVKEINNSKFEVLMKET
ncbi:cell adhesion protein [Clostridium botulinum]